MMSKEYHPIACGMYDELESLAVKKQICSIDYVDESEQAHSVESKIADVFSRSQEEFVQMQSGLLIRLDRIVRLNGKTYQSSCEVK